MESAISNLKPEAVFKYFEEISKIPRGSGNEKAISDYLVNFSKNHGLQVIQDESLNIIIRKPGTPGYENSPGVILQGHMDMVNEKNSGTVHDFDKDPLKLRVIDDMLYATDTTLGADNGIAVAMGMAVLASNDIPHPPIELLVTTEEETGMGGAMALDMSKLRGRMLINIDSEEEGKLLVSCAGGVRVLMSLPVKREAANTLFKPYLLTIKGLKGGHSGAEIDKGRGNSIKILGRVLNDLLSAFDMQLCSISGGSKMNAIPREAEAVLLFDSSHVSKVKDSISLWNETLKNELHTADPGISLSLEECEMPKDVLDKESCHKAISALMLMPCGIKSMSMDIKGLVESSNNLGVLTTNDDSILYECAIRSSVKSLKYAILEEIKLLAALTGSTIETTGDYPEWQYNPVSPIRDTFVRVYEKLYNKEPEIYALHAGVECGLFKEKLPDLDMISFGVNLYDVHTPDEHLSIPSTERGYVYLCEVLKELK
jgi:dipeptidase D